MHLLYPSNNFWKAPWMSSCVSVSMSFVTAGASGGVMVSKLDKQTYTSEFESHWVPLSYGLVPHLSKKLNKISNVLRHSLFHLLNCVLTTASELRE